MESGSINAEAMPINETNNTWQTFEKRAQWREILVEEFLYHQWGYFEIFNGYSIINPSHKVDGIENGRQAIIDVGVIDILARNNSGNWLVVELKRGRCADKTLGQIQRYMGWVKANLARGYDTVLGYIIGTHKDKKLEYALKVSRDVIFVEYSMFAEMTLDKKPRHCRRKYLDHASARSTNALGRGKCWELDTWVGDSEVTHGGKEDGS